MTRSGVSTSEMSQFDWTFPGLLPEGSKTRKMPHYQPPFKPSKLSGSQSKTGAENPNLLGNLSGTQSGRGPLKSSGGEPGKPTLPDDQAGSSSGQRPLKPANGKGGRSVVPSFTDEMLAASKPLASINFKAASGPSTRPGVLPSPCFPIFLARTTFVLESLPEVKNPGEDATFGDFLFNSINSLTLHTLDKYR